MLRSPTDVPSANMAAAKSEERTVPIAGAPLKWVQRNAFWGVMPRLDPSLSRPGSRVSCSQAAVGD